MHISVPGRAGSLAANKRKILEAARKHAQKGAKDKALKEYQKLLTLEPKDARLRLEVGDALRRCGQVPEAVVAYKKVVSERHGIVGYIKVFELKTEEFGETYNLSRERIRQLQEQALTKVRRALRSKDLM